MEVVERDGAAPLGIELEFAVPDVHPAHPPDERDEQALENDAVRREHGLGGEILVEGVQPGGEAGGGEEDERAPGDPAASVRSVDPSECASPREGERDRDGEESTLSEQRRPQRRDVDDDVIHRGGQREQRETGDGEKFDGGTTVHKRATQTWLIKPLSLWVRRKRNEEAASSGACRLTSPARIRPEDYSVLTLGVAGVRVRRLAGSGAGVRAVRLLQIRDDVVAFRHPLDVVFGVDEHRHARLAADRFHLGALVVRARNHVRLVLQVEFVQLVDYLRTVRAAFQFVQFKRHTLG